MRLIDADALMKIYADRMSVLAERYSIDSYACGTLAGAMKLLETQPTIEQPEIIHCKDCKKHHLGFGFCPMVHHSAENPLMVYELNDDDDFCSRAERVAR